MIYSKQQKNKAIELYKTTASISETIRILGYPTRRQLYNWIYESKQKFQKECNKQNYINTASHPRNPPIDVKLEAIRRCFENGESISSVSQDIGYSRASIHLWRKIYIENGTIGLMNTKNVQPGKIKKKNYQEDSEISVLKQQVSEMQLEIDVLKETINVLKKDPGINLTELTNKEKTVIIDAVKSKYSLSILLEKLFLSKSSYYYQERSLKKTWKYDKYRTRIIELFTENKKRYGYRRIHSLLKEEEIHISEKIVRKIMKEESLSVKIKKTGKYNSYAGEITPAVPNLLNRDFRAGLPNEKWLTDITEFAIPAGKVYLSPIIDCFDGLVVTWNIGTTPDSKLVNTMLDNAIASLKKGEFPVIHSDRGVHYRWPAWIERMQSANLTRSMSKKGCSPDNSACEGFFGRLKNEMFYNQDWSGVSIDEFITILNDYIIWYNTTRIKKSLGYKSPLKYRQSLGLVA